MKKINYENLETKLNREWNFFLRGLNGTVAIKEIKKPWDEKLKKQLSESRFFMDRLKSKSLNFERWPLKRQKEWCEGRRLELQMEENVLHLSGASLEGDTFLTSISHTDNLILGVGCFFSSKQHPEFQGVGVDIELAGRRLDPKTEERIISLTEKAVDIQLKALDHWVLKEAAFKATPRDLQLVVTQYQLVHWNPSTREGMMQSKSVRCEVKLLEVEGLKIGLSKFLA